MPEPRAMNISVFLDEVMPFNGPLMFIPRSHKSGVLEAGHDTTTTSYPIWSLDNATVARLAAEGGIVAPTGKPGSVLMFHGNLVHASPPNMTPYPRKIVYLTLCAVSNHITKFARPEWIAHRDFSPIVALEDDVEFDATCGASSPQRHSPEQLPDPQPCLRLQTPRPQGRCRCQRIRARPRLQIERSLHRSGPAAAKSTFSCISLIAGAMAGMGAAGGVSELLLIDQKFAAHHFANLLVGGIRRGFLERNKHDAFGDEPFEQRVRDFGEKRRAYGRARSSGHRVQTIPPTCRSRIATAPRQASTKSRSSSAMASMSPRSLALRQARFQCHSYHQLVTSTGR